MIAALGVFLLLAFGTPLQSSVSPTAPAVQTVPSRRATTASPSFEQIANAATQAWNDKRDDDAVRLFQQGLKLNPDWNEGLWYLGAIFYEKEHFREARDLLRHYVAQNPNQGPAWALIGLCDYKLREYERALEHLQRSISLGFGGREQLRNATLYHEAILLTREGQCEAGLRALYPLRIGSGSAAQFPVDLPAGLSVLCYQMLPEELPTERQEFVRKMGVAILARIDGHTEEASKILRELVKEYPNEKGVHYQYGSVLLQENSSDGIEEMQKVLAIAPSSTEARMELAAYYISQSQMQKARPYIDEVLKLDSSHPTAHLLQGEILMAGGDAFSAISELETAKQLAPGEGRALSDLLRAYTSAGRTEDAARVKAEIEQWTLLRAYLSAGRMEDAARVRADIEKANQKKPVSPK